MKSYTDLEQSKRLAEVLPLESADMGYLWNGTSFCEYPVSNQTIFKRVENIPCWSLAALLGVLPEGWSSVLTKSFDGEDYYCKLDGEPIETMADNPVDACYELIIKLKERNLI